MELAGMIDNFANRPVGMKNADKSQHLHVKCDKSNPEWYQHLLNSINTTVNPYGKVQFCPVGIRRQSRQTTGGTLIRSRGGWPQSFWI
jgi:hypothetical protein